MTGTVALYLRQSVSKSEGDDSLSLAAQEHRLRDYAQRNDLDVVGVFSDLDVSGATESRQGLDALLDACRTGAITHVGVYSLSRLARDSFLFLRIIRELDKLGIKFVSTSENTEDRTMTVILSAFAERERVQISNHVAWAVREAARRGRMILPPPYGYARIDGAITHDPLTGPIAQRIFARYAEGATLKEIAADLKADGIPSPEGLPDWRTTTITRMLGNRAYAGEIVVRQSRDPAGKVRAGLVAPGDFAPLIDPQTWEITQRRRAGGSHPRKATAYPAPWLAGIAVCAVCGSRLYLEIVRTKPDRLQPYWILRCARSRSPHGPSCPGQPVAKYAPFDLLARTALRADLRGMASPSEALARAESSQGAHNAARSDHLRATIADADARLKRAYEAYEGGETDLLAYGERKRELEVIKDRATHELAAVPTPPALADMEAVAAMADAADAILDAPESDLRALAVAIGAEAVVDLRTKGVTWRYAEPARWLLS